MKYINSKIEDLIRMLNLYSPENIARAIRILHKIVNDASLDEEYKQQCINKTAEAIAHINNHHCALKMLFYLEKEFGSARMLQDEYSISMIRFIKQFMSHPKVVDSYKSPRIKYLSFFYVVSAANSIAYFFDDEIALKVLNRTTNKNFFIVMGYHPAIVNDINLQIKWIKYCSRSRIIYSTLKLSNLTEKALLSAPINSSFELIERAIARNSFREFLNNMKYFNIETLKTMVFMYMIPNGRDDRANRMLIYIRHLEKLLESLQEEYVGGKHEQD